MKNQVFILKMMLLGGGYPTAEEFIRLFHEMIDGNSDAFKKITQTAGRGGIINRSLEGKAYGFVEQSDGTRVELE